MFFLFCFFLNIPAFWRACTSVLHNVGIQKPNERETELSCNDHCILKDVKVIAVKKRKKKTKQNKKKTTGSADWTQHDRNTPKRATQDTFERPSWKLTLCTPQLLTLFV